MRFVAAGKEGVSGFIVPSLLLLVVAYIAYQYLAAIGPYWNISPDSATYVEAARSLAGGSAHGIAASRPHPPVTSVLFAPLLAVWPDGYRALNGLNTALLLAALFLAYRLLVRKAGPRHAALTILLTLGSIRFFHESAQLLSEPAYMFLSLLVLFLIDRPRGQLGGRGREAFAGLALILVGLTRTIGLTLAVAVLVYEVGSRLRRDRPASPILTGSAVMAILAIAAWELYALSLGGTGNVLAELVDDPWAKEPSLLSPVLFLQRAFHNLYEASGVGGLLWNASRRAQGTTDFVLWASTSLVFLAGLFLSLSRRVSVTAAYVLLYVAVVTFHVLKGGFAPFRHLVPITPFLFHYSFVAVRAVLTRASGKFGIRLGPLVLIVAAVYAGWYMERGVGEIRRRVPEEHRSPFGDYPIKRSYSFDAQRLALWIGSHSPPDASFASWQPSMWQVVAERRGYDLWPTRAYSPEMFLDWLLENGVQFVLIDRKLPAAGRALETAMNVYPDRFRLIESLPDASLYEHMPG